MARDLKNFEKKCSKNVEKKKRELLSNRWCFTWNNYPEDWEEILRIKFLGLRWKVGEEIGESGTPHLQGYVEGVARFRPVEKFQLPKIHWEKAKGTRQQNIEYCSKENKFVGNLKTLEIPKMYGWQIVVEKIVEMECDKRSVYWFWEPTGNVGKSDCVTWLCSNGALKVGGKAADMKYSVVTQKESPEIIVIDLPRSAAQYFSYSGLEEIMGQVVASTKYESKMFIKNHSKVFVFANQEPNPGIDMSEDRFKVFDVRELIRRVGLGEDLRVQTISGLTKSTYECLIESRNNDNRLELGDETQRREWSGWCNSPSEHDEA